MPITIHKNEEIKGAAFQVEEHIFHDCRLINCALVYDGGSFSWSNTSLQSCQWTFRAAAKNTFELLRTIGLLKAAQTPPENLPDSTTLN